MQLSFAIIMYVLAGVSTLLGIFQFFVPSDKLSIGKKIVIFLIAAAFSLLCVFLIGQVDGLPVDSCSSAPDTPAPAPAVSVPPVSDSEPQEADTFEPDYRPGKENIYGCGTFYNQFGLVCRQDEMYYVAADDGIYKCGSDFDSFEKISDDFAVGLNVVASTIFYSAPDGLYSMRTDGAEKKKILEMDHIVRYLQYYDGELIFLDPADNRIYSYQLYKEKLKQIGDDMVGFPLMLQELYVYYREGKYDENRDIVYCDGFCDFVAASILADSSDADSVLTIIKAFDEDEADDPYVNGMIAPDSCAIDRSTSNIYYFRAAGDLEPICLYCLNLNSNEEKKLVDNISGDYPCFVDGYVYYAFWDSDGLPEGADPVQKYARYNTETGVNEIIGNPNENNYVSSAYYPVGDKIIIMSSDNVWYKYLYTEDRLEFIKFE